MSANILFELNQTVICRTKTWKLRDVYRERCYDEVFPTYGQRYTVHHIIHDPVADLVFLVLKEITNPARYEMKMEDGTTYKVPVIFDQNCFTSTFQDDLKATLSDLDISTDKTVNTPDNSPKHPKLTDGA
jgi:hypothetical protein